MGVPTYPPAQPPAPTLKITTLPASMNPISFQMEMGPPKGPNPPKPQECVGAGGMGMGAEAMGAEGPHGPSPPQQLVAFQLIKTLHRFWWLGVHSLPRRFLSIRGYFFGALGEAVAIFFVAVCGAIFLAVRGYFGPVAIFLAVSGYSVAIFSC